MTEIGESAFAWCSSLKSVNIPDTVTEIGESAFENCSALRNINIPDSVTKIGNNAFAYCKSLKRVTISNNITEISDSVFEQCYSLKNVFLPESVTKIGKKAFSYNSSLKNINIPNSLIEIGNKAFEDSPLLKNIIIPEGVKKIGERAFAFCALNITLPNSVEEIGYNAFCGVETVYYNGNLKGSTWGANQVINNNYDYIEVKLNETVLNQLGYKIKHKDDGEYVDQEFFINIQIKKNGQDIETLDIPSTYSYKGKNYKIVQIDKEVFCNCKSLKSVTIPDSITFIGKCAFGGCSSLTNI